MLSLVMWVLDWCFWKKKIFCFRECQILSIKFLIWWFAFIYLCGIIASCISCFVIIMKFGRIVRAVQCSYDRIYYDIQYGQLKESLPRWEGMNNNSLILKELKIIENLKNLEPIFFDDNWVQLSDTASFIADNIDNLFTYKGKYYKPYKDKMEKLLNFCENKGKLVTEDGQLFYDQANHSSIVGSFLDKVNETIKEIIEKLDKIDTYTNLFLNEKSYIEKINKVVKNLEKISKDFENYKNNILDKVEYYIKIAKVTGHTLVIIYLIILSLTTIFGVNLLIAYTCFKNQQYIDILMHITWNIIRFFVFSFLLYGTSFGMLYIGLRDAIAYNKFLFGEENLNKDTVTYLLPNKESKEFLRFCLIEEKANYISNLNFFLNGINDFISCEKLNNLFINDNYLDSYYNNSFAINKVNNRIRNLDEILSNSDEVDTTDDYSEYTFITDVTDSSDIIENITLPFNELNQMIMELNKTYNNLIKNIDFNNIKKIKNALIDRSGNFDCGFLKNYILMIYNTLYDLSVQSRILCVLSCCIGFFGEFAVNFYILVMYNYNKNPKKKEETTQFKGITIFDASNSRRTFMDRQRGDDRSSIKIYRDNLDFLNNNN